MQKLFLLFLVLCFLTMQILAQTRMVTGKITDEKGKPLSSVSVAIKGSNKGTITNDEGSFSLSISNSNSVLVVTYTGYIAQEIRLGGQSSISIQLKEENKELDAVVVTGYGTTKKKDLTGSVVSLKAEDLEKSVGANASSMLAGRAAGVVVVSTSSEPGGKISVQIRGSNSINNSSEPLYVIDGFPGNINNINPGDIESMEILKDASATAIYGTRAANGVVMITTKRAKNGKANVIYDGYRGVSTISKKIKLLNAKEHMDLYNLRASLNGNPPVYSDVYKAEIFKTIGEKGTDWQDEVLRSALMQNHQLTVTTGSDKSKISFSTNYFDQKGIVINTGYKRISANLGIDQKIGDRFTSAVNIRGAKIYTDKQNFNGVITEDNIMYALMTYDPAVPVRKADGSWGRSILPKSGNNPLVYPIDVTRDIFNENYHGDANLQYKIIEGLTAKVNAGYDVSFGTTGSYTPTTVQGSSGSASKRSDRTSTGLVEAFFQYDKKIKNIHTVNILGGYSYQRDMYEYLNASSSKYDLDAYLYNNLNAGSTKGNPESYKSQTSLQSYFGRANYSLYGKYLVTATLRVDGSSRFGKNNKYAYFPSGSFAWRLSEEQFIKDLNVFSNLKLRTSYGITGNDRIGDYQSLSRMKVVTGTIDGEEAYKGLIANNYPNPDLRWETTSQFDAGLDIGLLNGRFNIVADYYYKKTHDLIQTFDLTNISGFSSVLKNAGTIENKGFDLELSGRIIDKGAFKWSASVNMGFNKNKVLSLGGINQKIISSNKPDGSTAYMEAAILKVGAPLSSIYGYKWKGILQQGQTSHEQPNAVPGDPLFYDVDSDGAITPKDRTIIGNGNPDMVFGWNNTFEYKNFDLTLFFQGTVGNDLYNVNRLVLENNRAPEAKDFWRPNNPSTEIPRNGYYSLKYGSYENSRFVEDASYIRLKNIVFGYTFPGKWFKDKIGLRTYVNAQNLLTITKYTGFNPEVATDAGNSNYALNTQRGKDFNSFPAFRIIMFGLKLTL